MHPTPAYWTLRQFRTDLYAAFNRRADALLDLADALLSAGPVTAPVQLSLAPAYQRGWGSVYAALSKGQIDREALLRRLAGLPLADGPAIYAVDSSPWPRRAAHTSPERGYCYSAAYQTGGQPVVAGWSYQWITQLNLDDDSWTAPMDALRVRPDQNIHDVAVSQIRALLARQAPAPTAPLFVFDAGYDPVQLTLALADTAVAILVRLRKDRCFFADPPQRDAPTLGRPRRHGAKFDCKQPTNWPTPSGVYTAVDEHYGVVRVRAWAGLHARPKRQVGRQRNPAQPLARGTVVLVEVERVPGQGKGPQVLWLWWAGPGSPDLALLWRAYLHRFDVEHTFRLCKQSLGWTTPRLRQPEQADRWTLLVLAVYTQLRLARPLVADRRLPWERPLPAGQVTPYRVLRAFPALLPRLGTLSSAPKPCGRSPGRPKGRRSARAPRFPPFKKAC
jgi:hypothetical protein